jgi:uncharacterized protein YndB with AHSA1/START domain
MATIKTSVTIGAPVEKIFAYASDPTHTPEYWTSMEQIRNVKIQDGVVKTYDWTYKMAGMKLDGTAEVVEHVPNRRIKTVSKGGIESTITWVFTPVEGGTRMDGLTEYKIPMPVLGRLAEGLIHKQNEKEAENLMANLKKIMES